MSVNKRLKKLLIKRMNECAKRQAILDYEKWIEERLKETLEAHGQKLSI